MTELGTFEGCDWIVTEEGEDMIHQFAEMRVTVKHIDTDVGPTNLLCRICHFVLHIYKSCSFMGVNNEKVTH